MNITRSLALPAAALALIAGGLTLGACQPAPSGVGGPTPTSSAPFTLPPVLAAAARCEEDEPCWDCESMGNRICSGTDLTEESRRSAWAAWDAAGGPERLLVNTHARVTLSGYTLTDPYTAPVPVLAADQLALHGAGVWYIFTAQAI